MAGPRRTEGPASPFFNKGIVNVSRTGAKDLAKLSLPELMPFSPSESPIEEQLPKMWKSKSLQNLLLEALAPKITAREGLTPSMYQSRLKKARKHIVKKLKDSKDHKNQEDAERYEALLEDFEEMDENNELLWLLRQVVHLA